MLPNLISLLFVGVWVWICLLWDKVSLCSLVRPGTPQLATTHLSVSRVLGLKSSATTQGPGLISNYSKFTNSSQQQGQNCLLTPDLCFCCALFPQISAWPPNFNTFSQVKVSQRTRPCPHQVAATTRPLFTSFCVVSESDPSPHHASSLKSPSLTSSFPSSPTRQ